MSDWLEALLILIGLGALICCGARLGVWHAWQKLDRAGTRRQAARSTEADAAMAGTSMLPAVASGSEDGSGPTFAAGSVASSMSSSYSSGSVCGPLRRAYADDAIR